MSKNNIYKLLADFYARYKVTDVLIEQANCASDIDTLNDLHYKKHILSVILSVFCMILGLKFDFLPDLREFLQ